MPPHFYQLVHRIINSPTVLFEVEDCISGSGKVEFRCMLAVLVTSGNMVVSFTLRPTIWLRDGSINHRRRFGACWSIIIWCSITISIPITVMPATIGVMREKIPPSSKNNFCVDWYRWGNSVTSSVEVDGLVKLVPLGMILIAPIFLMRACDVMTWLHCCHPKVYEFLSPFSVLVDSIHWARI